MDEQRKRAFLAELRRIQSKAHLGAEDIERVGVIAAEVAGMAADQRAGEPGQMLDEAVRQLNTSAGCTSSSDRCRVTRAPSRTARCSPRRSSPPPDRKSTPQVIVDSRVALQTKTGTVGGTSTVDGHHPSPVHRTGSVRTSASCTSSCGPSRSSSTRPA